eukprot:6195521-Pleurochrysis_carterae.AAC.11
MVHYLIHARTTLTRIKVKIVGNRARARTTTQTMIVAAASTCFEDKWRETARIRRQFQKWRAKRTVIRKAATWQNP